MRSRKKTAVYAGLGVLAAGLLFYCVLPPGEPTYQGRKLSVWLRNYDVYSGLPATGPFDTAGADAAVAHAGESAIPLLLRLLEAKDSPLATKFYALLSRQHIIPINHRAPEYLHTDAACAFLVLGESASNAVPGLIRIYEKRISPHSQSAAAASLGYIGPPASEAIPALLRNTTNENWSVRRDAIVALGKIHESPRRAVPALLHALNDTNAPPGVLASMSIRLVAIQGLGAFGDSARPAVPELVAIATNRKDLAASWYALEALKKIDPDTAKTIPGIDRAPGPDRLPRGF